MKMVEINGKTIPLREAVMVDHCVSEFKVVIRSMKEVSPDNLKTLLQQKYEVVDCSLTDETLYVHA